MALIENGKSSVDNLSEVDWAQQQTREELNALTNNVESNFYEKKEDGTVVYKMDLVKQYLSKIKEEVKDKDTREAWRYLQGKQNTAAWIMAVQIALASKGYEVGKIDGVLGERTKEGVRSFQTAKKLENVDGLPGKTTIDALLEALGENLPIKAKEDMKIKKGGTPEAKEFLENVPEGAKVEYVETVDFSTLGEKTFKVKVSKTEGSETKDLGTYDVKCEVVEKDVVDDGSEFDGNLPDGYARTLEDHIKELFNPMPDLGGTDTVVTNVVGNKLYLKSNRSIRGGVMYGRPSVEINLKKCVDSKGNFMDERIKNIIIPDAVKMLKDKKKALAACDQIRGKKYRKDDIFGGVSLNSIDETLVNNYFRYFNNGILEFNDDSTSDTSFDITGDNANVRLRLDDKNGDEDWNKRNNNPDLIFPGLEIVNDDFQLDEMKLKGKLKDIILKIIRREDFR